MIFLLAGFPLAAAEPDGSIDACPLPVAETSRDAAEGRAVRRLRTAPTANAGRSSVDLDLAELAFVTSPWPNPAVRDILQVPGEERTRLTVTVVNNSRHASPDGGITLSFPEFTRPTDRARIGQVAVPDGMALHVIPAGGELFGRNGLAQDAGHLMIEVQGAWQPRQARTLELDVLGTADPVIVRYRSAFSDRGGDYHNTPAESALLDQQGWPAFACVIASADSVSIDEARATARSGENDARPGSRRR